MRSACSTSSARDNGHGGRWWTLRGRRNQRPPPAGTTEPPAEQDETRSPLTDSNRRPPPYRDATGGSRSQRISLVFAVSRAGRFAADCHRLQPRGSIKAPSAALRVSNLLPSTRSAYHVRATDHRDEPLPVRRSWRAVGAEPIGPGGPVDRRSQTG